jgi:hypothetical protein
MGLNSSKNKGVDSSAALSSKLIKKAIRNKQLAPILEGQDDDPAGTMDECEHADVGCEHNSTACMPYHYFLVATSTDLLLHATIPAVLCILRYNWQVLCCIGPVCLLHFPAINTAACCGSSLCTDCYVQVGAKWPVCGM